MGKETNKNTDIFLMQLNLQSTSFNLRLQSTIYVTHYMLDLGDQTVAEDYILSII